MRNVVLIVVSCLLLTACADAVPSSTASPDGFLVGLWHGFILPFAFLISLFDGDVAIYSLNNSGGWYDFGFVFGIGIFGGATNTR